MLSYDQCGAKREDRDAFSDDILEGVIFVVCNLLLTTSLILLNYLMTMCLKIIIC
jgi:hypothetical protein